MKIEEVESILGYTFTNKELVKSAIFHPGVHYSKKISIEFEKLEFLGDRVLGLCLACLVYRNLSPKLIGEFAIRLAKMGSTEMLVHIAEDTGLINCFNYVKYENTVNKSAVADMMEALLAAIFLDGGLDVSLEITKRIYLPYLETKVDEIKDNKSKLQEYTQGKKMGLPIYHVNSTEGPEHDIIFAVEVSVSGIEHRAIGRGHSKKEAEQVAAGDMLEYIASLL